MRRFAFVAVALGAAGCSLIWDMDPYEGGDTRAAQASDGAASDATTASDGGARLDVGTTPRTSDAAACAFFETEPNNDDAQAENLEVGVTCGQLITVADIDRFDFSVATTVTFGYSLATPVRLRMERVGSGIELDSTGSDGTRTLDPGIYIIELTHTSSSPIPGAYRLTRGN